MNGSECKQIALIIEYLIKSENIFFHDMEYLRNLIQ